MRKFDFWMLTCNGMIQWHVQGELKGILFAYTAEDAEAIAVNRGAASNKQLSVAKVGAVPGETFDSLIAVSFQMGANGIWRQDRHMKLGFLALNADGTGFF